MYTVLMLIQTRSHIMPADTEDAIERAVDELRSYGAGESIGWVWVEQKFDNVFFHQMAYAVDPENAGERDTKDVLDRLGGEEAKVLYRGRIYMPFDKVPYRSGKLAELVRGRAQNRGVRTIQTRTIKVLA